MVEIVEESVCEEALEMLITKTLHLLGIPAHLRGHNYLREAIIMAINDPDAVGLITKIIYPDIAKMYTTTPSKVNRAMCHALDVAWDRGLGGPLTTAIFPAKTSKPKNSEFILELANYITSHELIEKDNKS